jgi:hypothetical protein
MLYNNAFCYYTGASRCLNSVRLDRLVERIASPCRNDHDINGRSFFHLDECLLLFVVFNSDVENPIIR